MTGMPDKRVLIVEDSKSVNRMLQYLFMARGFRVESAFNGLEALTLLEKIMPDVVILDLMMPEMDGFSLCEKLKLDARFKDIPIIVLSAMKEDENAERLLAMGVADYFEKPFISAELVERVSKMVESSAS